MAPLIVLTTGAPEPDRSPLPSPEPEGAAPPGQDAQWLPQWVNYRSWIPSAEALVEWVVHSLETLQGIASETLSSHVSGGQYNTGVDKHTPERKFSAREVDTIVQPAVTAAVTATVTATKELIAGTEPKSPAERSYFWPDMPTSYGAGRVVDYDGARYFRDVNAFVAQVKDSVAYYTAEVVRNNLQNCLKGQAFIWYSDIVPQSTKKRRIYGVYTLD
ncbi:hypothetical protein FN846DRAFT_906030 [Sphaerosporella brunnea]|uniref:Uncharacterized protein n=1 Tax=Sphaerosporella brunnea TaxID=1250544 RepID=A0A5J5EZS0_9PEZI|nr:hypothetical protein FN846DRAFT_906030 [Sphaerosporella brunnea]